MGTFGWRRQHSVAAAVVGLVVLASGVSGCSALGGSEPSGALSTAGSTPTATSTEPSPTEPDQPPTDPLTGGKVSGNEVVAVKVENIGLARPQVGLHAADIIFAEEVEGAQTRLIAIYHRTFPTAVEPVRSARSTDVQLLPLFGTPGLVYSGANASVQRKIDDSPIVPLYNQTRDPRRSAPHNVRVNLAKVVAAKKMGQARSIGWTFAAHDDRLSAAESAATVKAEVGHDIFTFGYAKDRYTVRWNGKTYVDGENGTPTLVDNVVVMNVHNHPDGNRDVAGSASVQSDTVGRGKVKIYREGKVLVGTWTREKRSEPMHFRDASGRDIPLKPGQTWVALHG